MSVNTPTRYQDTLGEIDRGSLRRSRGVSAGLFVLISGLAAHTAAQLIRLEGVVQSDARGTTSSVGGESSIAGSDANRVLRPVSAPRVLSGSMSLAGLESSSSRALLQSVLRVTSLSSDPQSVFGMGAVDDWLAPDDGGAPSDGAVLSEGGGFATAPSSSLGVGEEFGGVERRVEYWF
jgi:hypothetical protein